MDNLQHQLTVSANSIFSGRFLESKSLYLYFFHSVPSIHFTGNINGEKAYKAFRDKFKDLIRSEHQYRSFQQKQKKYGFRETLLVLANQCLVEFNDSYCEILHNGQEDDFIRDCTVLVSAFKERQRRQPLEINLIADTSYGLDLKSMEIKRTRLDLDLFYEDDFREVDRVIQTRLKQKKDKGIVFLHGLPGTGKTTYLRYLIGKIRKRVLFLSPSTAQRLTNPDFVELLIDNQNTVLIIEDAENIIRDRNVSANSSVSNLLNISDGLLADFLNVQLICTFNSPLTHVDQALIRREG